MKLLIIGSSIIAISPVDTGIQWETEDQIIPKSVADGAVIVDARLPENFSIATHEYIAGEVVMKPPSADELARVEAVLSDKIARLWSAADSYTSRYIKGLAVGLLTIGVMQNKPKSMSISAWSNSIWDEYYARKAVLLSGGDLDIDFSMFGPMPYSVPEIRIELGL